MTIKISSSTTPSASFSGAPSLPLSEKLKKVIEKIKDCIASAFQMLLSCFSLIFQGMNGTANLFFDSVFVAYTCLQKSYF